MDSKPQPIKKIISRRLSLGSGAELVVGGEFCLSFYALPLLNGLTFFVVV